MSLILDALRKLEREKDAREPGVLVVGSVPWGARARSRRPLLALAAIALVAVAAFVLRRPAPSPPGHSPEAPASSPAAIRPAAAATVSARSPAPPAPTPPLTRRPSVASPVGATRVEPPGTSGATDTAASDVVRSEAGPAGGLRLNAISQRDGKPVALINDRLVFEGDSFDGVLVLHIGETEVEVEVRGRKRVLRF